MLWSYPPGLSVLLSGLLPFLFSGKSHQIALGAMKIGDLSGPASQSRTDEEWDAVGVRGCVPSAENQAGVSMQSHLSINVHLSIMP